MKKTVFGMGDGIIPPTSSPFEEQGWNDMQKDGGLGIYSSILGTGPELVLQEISLSSNTLELYYSISSHQPHVAIKIKYSE